MSTRRTSHTVYDAKYHLMWAPKYRKWVLRGDIRKRVGELFREIGDRHDIEIDTLYQLPNEEWPVCRIAVLAPSRSSPNR